MDEDAPTLVIDANYIGHQARATMGELSNDDVPTGVIFGFLSRILSLSHSFKTNHLAFCWDSKHSYRKKKYPAYKQKRIDDKTEEELKQLALAREQFTKLRRKILPAIGFRNIFMQPCLEADDLIASIVFGKLGDWVIVSADQDLYQCLQNNTRMFNPSKRKMMTVERFKEEYKIHPSKWKDVKGIAGRTSDNLPGVKGVGESTAIKYLREKLKKDSVKYKAIEAGIESGLVEAHMRLVKLPYPKTKEPIFAPNEFDVKGLKRVCKKYGLSSFLKGEGLQDWKGMMKGEFRDRRRG